MATETKKNLSVEERRRINNRKYQEYMNGKVDVNIPLGGEPIGTTTTASCDGKVYEIELGKTVQVPRKVAEVINRSIDGNIEVQKKMQEAATGVKQIGEF
jgi:polynucleotide 5'-kinase involved in rRNA processing